MQGSVRSGWVGVFQNRCFWVWSPAGSQAVDWVVGLIVSLGLGCAADHPLTDLVAHPPGVSGVGPRPLIGVCVHWGTLGLAPRHLGRLSGCLLTQSFSCGPPVR